MEVAAAMSIRVWLQQCPSGSGSSKGIKNFEDAVSSQFYNHILILCVVMW